MSKRFSSSDEEPIEEPLINLTPLIDVVFVVLITFMIIAPFLQIDKVQLAPGSSSKEREPLSASTPLAITVRSDNTIWVQQKMVQPHELKNYLLQSKRGRPKETPQLIQDSRASFGTYQMVKNLVEECGYEELDVILKPQ